MSSRWTMGDIERKGLKIAGNANKIANPVKTIASHAKKEPKAILHIKTVLKKLNIGFIQEHTFLPGRKYRFDVAVPDKKIGIEYEGLVSSKSRHTTLTGYSNDCIKYNLAQKNGWIVLRYTVMNYLSFERDILELMSKR